MAIPKAGPHQLLGMEINAYARELAQVVIWIGYLQWRITNGFGWDTPILRDLRTITLQDALLDVASGPVPGDREVQRTVWPKADYIIGNPPFLGAQRMRSQLGPIVTGQLFTEYGAEIPNGSDLCCYFLERARNQIERNESHRAGLLASQAVRKGGSNVVLRRIKKTGDIFMTWADEPWVLDGAAVRISIVGFDDGSESYKSLNGLQVETINSDLTAHLDLTTAHRLTETDR